MPAIKAYKSKGKIIPVDAAKVGKAFQCPWTDELFGTKRGYITHLTKLRETRMHKRAKQNIRDKKFADFYNQPSLEAVVNWVNTIRSSSLIMHTVLHGHTIVKEC